jgi:L-seryl-tRNA(Ser) seleniumtransferase
VAPAVFNTDETEHLGLAGSIPVRLRQWTRCVAARSAWRGSGRPGEYGGYVRDIQADAADATGTTPVGADVRRGVPRTDTVLADVRVREQVERLGRARVKTSVARVQQLVREGQLEAADVVPAVLADLPSGATSQRRVVNATGVLLHTNLGRAPLSDAAVEALVTASGTTDLELDLGTGSRGGRGRAALEALTAAVPHAQAAHVVGNGAAALVLAATALAQGREIVVSRGEMVEIGDGFRLPDLIVSTGARLREVGTTNRTVLADYTAAIGPQTGFVLKVHPSNFEVRGFTSAVSVRQLRGIGVPVVVDIGSGLLRRHPALPDEPDADTVLRDGADLVTASGDKLVGGPQAGLLLGSADVISRLRRHPLARALRVGKLTLAALEATLTGPATPTAQALDVPVGDLSRRAELLSGALRDHGVPAEAMPSEAAVGGGGAPGVVLPSAAVRLPEWFAAPLRVGEPSVVGRVEHGVCLLDLRSVPAAADDDLAAAVLTVWAGGPPA